MDDPIVADIHATRRRIFAECGEDIEKLIARLRAAEKLDQSRVVTMRDIERREAEPDVQHTSSGDD